MVKKIIIVLILSICTYIGFKYFTDLFNVHQLDDEENTNFNESPVEVFHIHEFVVGNSNYLEKNYERYISYKSKHTDLSDEKVITYVNIGLDNEFYTNMQPSNMEDGILVLCNKYNYLASNYVPSNMVETYGTYSYGGRLVKEAFEAFKKMADAAKKDGYTIKITSPYRSYSSQKSIYANYVNRDGVKKADTYSARAGSSEHQTGLAIDINDNVVSYSNFRNSKSYGWMKNNSYKYGWILRYTKENQWITGYKQEEWHYRYVGKEASKYIYEHNITFEEYYVTYLQK